MARVNRDNSLREWRLSEGLTLKQLALKTGLKYSYLIQLEKGLRKGTSNTWIKIARELQIPVKDLFEGKVIRSDIGVKYHDKLKETRPL